MARIDLDESKPTFPSPSLEFRTAGFPQYGFKAGMSDTAFPTTRCNGTSPESIHLTLLGLVMGPRVATRRQLVARSASR